MRVMLLDDHTLFRESLHRLLDGSPEWQVVGKYGKGAEAIAAVRDGLAVDLALIDYELDPIDPQVNHGLLVASELRKLQPHLPILMVTAGMPGKELARAVQAAHVGVFLKSESAEELFLAMRRTARGDLWVSSSAALVLVEQSQAVPAAASEGSFSARERLVLSLLLEGLTNKEIGARLAVSESSVKAILQRLFERAGVRSRSQLVRFAIEQDAGAI